MPARSPGWPRSSPPATTCTSRSIGSTPVRRPAPLGRDAICRIASLTKPVVAAAALSMLADGTLDLDQPVDDLLPELAGRRVLRAIDAELDDTVPADAADHRR